jgi:hypothetical protein
MRTIRRLVAVTLTSSVVAALVATELALRSAEEFSEGWRYGMH